MNKKASTHQLSNSLFWGFIVLLLIATLFTYYHYELNPDASEELETPSVSVIAVYPFDDENSLDGSPHFIRGVADTIRSRLSSVQDIKVISRTTSIALKNKKIPLTQLKETYGIGAVLKGSVHKGYQSLRVSLTLINTGDGSILWSTDIDEYIQDIFKVQNDIAQALASTLKIKLSKDNMPSGITVNAFEHYLSGRLYWSRRNVEDVERAIQHFSDAIKLAPDYAQAYVGLSDAYLFLHEYGDWPKAQAHQRAEQYIQRALLINKDLPEAHATIGRMAMENGHHKDAEKAYQKAIELNPSNVRAYHWYGILMNNLGQHKKALELHQTALSLDPLSVIINRNMAYSHQLNGQTELAKQFFDRSIDVGPTAYGNPYLQLNFYPLTQTVAKNAITFISEKYHSIPQTVPHKITLSLFAISLNKQELAEHFIAEAHTLASEHPRILDAQIALEASQKKWPQVITLLQRRIQQQPENLDLKVGLVYATWLNNDTTKAQSLIQQASPQLAEHWRIKLLAQEQLSKKELNTLSADIAFGTNNDPVKHAAILIRLGETDSALTILEKAINAGWLNDANQTWWTLEHDLALSQLNEEPRFQALLQKLETNTFETSKLWRHSSDIAQE
ncbi:tetratricopeptide repeat protein [Pleionea sp. CnH1-48]|uniref:tetratricopeptide repeat protein n=1 Tax=Pleionea sp. CnH1-48 TaxID=2954494 RepID=UPI0020970B68|nr:tetratricopeptide repeat protein [Pleionea sp. CnH1-48]MCO7225221.1 tetratricopeptide repeat protein [Pleionea sp. CnH1-48]